MRKATSPNARRVRAALVLLLAVAWVLGATAYLFVWPRTDAPARADAVVVLGHGLHGERLPAALALMERGVAPVLVVSAGRTRGSQPPARVCRGEARFRVVCFRADPFTTRGEARAVGTLAGREAWRSLVLVTSTYHVRRARMLHERCYRGRIAVVGARPDAGIAELTGAIAHEWGGLLYALTLARAC